MSAHASRRPRGARARSLVVALLVLLALIAGGIALGARGGGSSRPQSARSGIVGALDLVSVSGRVGATPVVALEAPVTVDSLKARVLEEGTGREITDASPVLLSLTSFDGANGEMKSTTGRPRLLVGPATADALGAEIASIVIGATEGSRILALHPLASAKERTSEITVVDVLGSIAYGDEAAEAQSGALSVEMTPEGPLVRHGADVPGGLTTQTLIAGDGVQVRAKDRVVAQYTVVGWSDGIVRSSTWRTGMPELVPLDSAMKGLSEALVDRRVGSRLAITIPPDLATGDDTLCVVVDVLGAEPAGESGSEPTPAPADSPRPRDASQSAQSAR